MKIAIINKSTLVSNEDVKLMTRAVALQCRRDFAPAWEVKTPNIRYRVDESTIEPSTARIVIFDDADQAGAFGYHSDGPDGYPYARVFCRDALKYATALQGKYAVSVILSHEVLELLADPSVNLWADLWNGMAIAYEVCDPVQADAYDVEIDGKPVSVSNFVTPSWFDNMPPAGAKFDHLGTVGRHYTMSPGGYVVTRESGAEKVYYGAEFPEWKKAAKEHPAARTHKRGA